MNSSFSAVTGFKTILELQTYATGVKKKSSLWQTENGVLSLPELVFLVCVAYMISYHKVFYFVHTSSIHPSSIPTKAYPNGHQVRTPWTGHQSITGPHRDKQPHTLTLTPKDNFRVTN